MNRMTYRGGQGTIPGGPLGKARFALANGRPDEAERICRKRLERSPDDTSARVLLAQALLQEQMIAEAVDQARRVTREQPTNVDAYLVLASGLLQRPGALGRVPAEAEQAARRAVTLSPKTAKTHVQLAEVLAAKREFAAARAEADEAIRLEPRLAGAHLMRAAVLLSDKDPEAAIQASDAALRYDRTLSQAEFLKANALVDVKRYDDALSALDAATEKNPLLGGPNAIALRGRILFKKRKIRQSYATFLQVQLMSGRLKWLAPVLAALNMVFMGFFGQNAQYAWTALIIVLIMLVLFGVSAIPVVGIWIASALVLVVVGVSVFGYVRWLTGRLLPGGLGPLATTLVAIIMGGAAAFAIVGAIIAALSANVFHMTGTWFTPVTFTIAGAVAIIVGGVVAYFWPRATARYMGR